MKRSFENALGKGPSEMATPQRPRGRPALPPGEAKRYPLGIRTTKALRDDLVEASKISGRSLTEEIEFHIQRSLSLDRDKDGREIQLERVMAEVMALVRAIWSAAPTSEVHVDQEGLAEQLLAEIDGSQKEQPASITPKRQRKSRSS
jgi:hypothetical protein